jgi:hypothetical protein
MSRTATWSLVVNEEWWWQMVSLKVPQVHGKSEEIMSELMARMPSVACIG